MLSTVSIRGQTVIPRMIREAMGIVPQTRLEWMMKDGIITVLPIPPDPVRAAVGILKGRGVSTATLLAERQADREREL